jgi:peptide/nickel transport system substrate-binding protein
MLCMLSRLRFDQLPPFKEERMSPKPARLWLALALAAVFATTSVAVASSRTGANTSQVTIAIPNEPSTFDVSLYEDGNMQSVSMNIFEGLTTRDDKMNVRPQLATSWKRTKPSMWVFKIRHGVKFQNGEPFDARAAAYSLGRVLTPANNSELISWVPTIQAVHALDRWTLVVETKGPDPNIPGVLYYIPMVPPHYTSTNPKGFARNPIGTGPYKLVKWSAGQSITMTRWSGYWGPKPAIKDIKVIWRPEAQVRLSALQAGEVQVAKLDPDQAKQAPRVTTAPGTEVAEMGFDAQPGRPLADQRLRMAINLSIDRKALMKYIFGGFARPANGQLDPPGSIGYDSKLKDYPFDLARAQQLVQSANAKGKEIVLVAAQGRWPKDAETVQALAGMISKTGLSVKVQFLEWSDFLKRVFDRSAQADLMYFAASSDTFDASRVITTLLLSPAAGGTLTRYSNPTIDSLLKQAIAAPTLASKNAIYAKLWQTAYNAAAMMPVVGLENIYGTSKNLIWQARPDSRILVKTMRYR